ncbi:GNAT family N-acetyltransferase [Candidatus Amarolinea aalborgensis]|uniref:GNAT family N-acetyltransferase n=1 Tax=Candidatus Amarolinea aalborgensis TaxID=2249329 RepID=UPI003BFA069D
MLDLDATPLQESDLPAVVTLVNEALTQAPFSAPVTVESFRRLGLLNEQGTLYGVALQNDPAGWLVMRNRDAVIGFVHACTGRLTATTTPAGFIRFLVFPPGRVDVGAALLAAAEKFLRAAGARTLYAWHPQAGYPFYHAGVGISNGQDFYGLSALSEAGYLLTARVLSYQCVLGQPMPEYTPAIRLRCVMQQAAGKPWSLTAFLPGEPKWCATVRLAALPASLAVEGKPRAYLLEATVQEDLQRQGIGRWLLQRTCNEFSARGCAAIIAHATHQQAAAQSVLLQAGFEELSFRGYTFERQ